MHNALQRIFYKISIVEQDRAFCSWVFPSFISHSSIGFFSRCSKHRSTIPFSSFYFLSSFPTDSKNFNFSGFLFLSSNLLCAQSLRRVWLFVTPMDCSPPGSSVPEDSPGKNTEVGCHALLQGIFPTHGSNPGLLHRRWNLYRLSHKGSLGKPSWLKL